MNHTQDDIVEILKMHTPIVQCAINKQIYVSILCPFCESIGKRVFRYNSKLRVGKSYCCGVSFKEKYWLIRQLSLWELILRMSKDKWDDSDSEFEKFKQDCSLPF